MLKQLSKNSPWYYLHTLIALLIIVCFFQFVPAVEPLTPVGIRVLGIFIAVLYGWVFCDVVWPSLMGLIMLGMCGYDSITKVFATSMGNSTVITLRAEAVQARPRLVFEVDAVTYKGDRGRERERGGDQREQRDAQSVAKGAVIVRRVNGVSGVSRKKYAAQSKARAFYFLFQTHSFFLSKYYTRLFPLLANDFAAHSPIALFFLPLLSFFWENCRQIAFFLTFNVI